MLDLVWLIPALPLAGFLAILVGGRRLGEPLAGWLATAAVTGSFLTTVVVFLGLLDRPGDDRFFSQILFEWIPAGGLVANAGFLVDPLSITMALFVTGVASLIHLYSIGYMHGDPNFSKFFMYLNVFVFSMLILVLGDNMLMTFLGWEGVGTCSYLLISFWFDNEANASAGKKAFVTNRIGDWGFLLGMFLTFITVGSLAYVDVNAAATAGQIVAVTATGMALLFFIGAIGKSAQLPLFVWLPDAMAGPTPVSALIHAATMVTAGVYLFVRISPIVAAGYDWVPQIIAWVGVLTALVAATIAISQNDIKKVLAYSTVSQLGFMFFAIGSGAYVAALFHVITHAFFKALLFLGSGSVIHGMNDDQDMRHMGGLARFMPITAGTFIVGWLAIAGFPPFAGFWSKDEILVYAYANSKPIWVLGSIAALLTAFYMSRQVFMVFFGEKRWEGDEENFPADFTPHESPWTMTTPLVVLAGAAVVAGAMNLPFSHNLHFLGNWLEPSLWGNEAEIGLSGGTKIFIAVFSTALAAIGVFVAANIYLKGRPGREAIEQEAFAKGWWIDSTITKIAGGPGRAAWEAAAWFDRTVIDGAVNGVASRVRAGGSALRLLQTGLVRTYTLAVGFGVIFIGVWLLTRANF